MLQIAFSPMGLTVCLAAGLTATTTQLLQSANQVEVYNSGTVAVFVAFGSSASLATPAIPAPGSPALGVAVPPGSVMVFTCVPLAYVGVIAASAGGNVYFTPGEGM